MAPPTGSRTRGIVLVVLVAAMALLLAHGIFATLSGPRTPTRHAAEAPERASAAASVTSHQAAPPPAAAAGTVTASEDTPSGARIHRGVM